MKTLFLTLRVFSATGGIEKVCRIMGKALYEAGIKNEDTVQICSMYDRHRDSYNNPYFPSEIFRGFGINKLFFINEMVIEGAKSDVVILSHINLLLIGWVIKKISPSTKIVLLAHGIEIWYPLGSRRRSMLHRCDLVLAVSTYTKNVIIDVHELPGEKCAVLNNCLDPYLPLPSILKKNKALLDKYGFNATDTILMTLTRLSSKERYKGYDNVIRAMAVIKPNHGSIKYLVAGSFDDNEKSFVDGLLRQYGLEDNVALPGYIEDEELEDHFAMSDMYVMPSRKEGFGIVFIEAMYYGLPVIAGNQDGSTDALLNGQLGQLVNPEDVNGIASAITNIVERRSSFIPGRKLLMQNFSYETYKECLEDIFKRFHRQPVHTLNNASI